MDGICVASARTSSNVSRGDAASALSKPGRQHCESLFLLKCLPFAPFRKGDATTGRRRRGQSGSGFRTPKVSLVSPAGRDTWQEQGGGADISHAGREVGKSSGESCQDIPEASQLLWCWAAELPGKHPRGLLKGRSR